MKSTLSFLLLLVFALASCTTTTDPYSGRLGKNGTSNNMGDGPSNTYGNTAGMTGAPRTPPPSQ